MSFLEEKRIEMVSKVILEQQSNSSNISSPNETGSNASNTSSVHSLHHHNNNNNNNNNNNTIPLRYDDDMLFGSPRSQEAMTEEDEESENYLHEYFMNVAFLSAKKRKEFKHQAGACIVNPRMQIVGIGHNTSSSKNPAAEFFSWLRDNSKTKKPEFVYHAELNAILNKKEFSLSNCTIFVTEFPCIECAKLIIQSDIKKVVYTKESQCQSTSKQELHATKLLFNLSGVKLIELK